MIPTAHVSASNSPSGMSHDAVQSVVAAGLIAICLWLIWLASVDIRSCYILSNTEWQKQPATLFEIDSAEVKGGMSGWTGSSGRRWIADVRYGYSVSGAEFIGDTLCIGSERIWSRIGREERTRIIAEVEARSPIYVWVDKDDASRSVVVLEDLGTIVGSTYVLVILGGLMFAAGGSHLSKAYFCKPPR